MARHEGDRRAEPGLRPQRGDPSARLHGGARGAEQIAERGRGLLEVLDQEGESPEPCRTVGIAGHARALRGLHHLEDRLADAEERLPSGAAGRFALADAPQVEAVRAQVLHRTVEIRRHQHHVVDPGDPVRVRWCRGRHGTIAERPSQDPAARPLPHQSQQDARHLARAVLDVEPGRAPVVGLVGDLELLERRHARDATRRGRYFGSLSWPGGVAFGAGSGSAAASGAAGSLTAVRGFTRSTLGWGAGFAVGACCSTGALVLPRSGAFA